MDCRGPHCLADATSKRFINWPSSSRSIFFSSHSIVQIWNSLVQAAPPSSARGFLNGKPFGLPVQAVAKIGAHRPVIIFHDVHLAACGPA